MTVAPDKVTRFAADLVDAAAVEGARQSRSAKQQLDHWARVGRAVSSQGSYSWRRIEAALQGTLPMRELSGEEGAVFNAEIEARIEERLNAVSTTDLLRSEGKTTVSLDKDGNLVRRSPDGSTTIIGEVPL